MDISPAIEAKEIINFTEYRNVPKEQPPSKFLIENEPKPAVGIVACKLCLVPKRKFICKPCLRNGNFTSLSLNCESERFLDKQQKLKNLKNAIDLLNDKFTTQIDGFIKLENLQKSIIKYRKQNSILREALKEKRESIQKLQETKKDNHDKNRALRIILPKYEDKTNKLGDFVLEAIDKNEALRKKKHDQMEELRNLRRQNIDKLIKYIFPISQRHSLGSAILNLKKGKKENLSNETIAEITEAMLAGGQNDSLNDYSVKEYTVVTQALTLPADGNYYDEYCKWLTFNKLGTSGNSDASQVTQNAAYRIVAGLTYVSQLVEALSFILDVRLPHKMNYHDFCKIVLNEHQFRKKVAKLNLNVVYLSYMQNVSSRNIQPARILDNISLLLDVRNDNLGITGPINDTSDTKSIDSIMLSFTDLMEENEDNDTDLESDDDVTHKEWENVTNIPSAAEVTQSAMIPHENSSGMTNTIVNAANSFFFNRWSK